MEKVVKVEVFLKNLSTGLKKEVKGEDVRRLLKGGEMVWEYLKKAEKVSGFEPSFWMSEDYFNRALFKEEKRKNSIFVLDRDGNFMFPGIDKGSETLKGVSEVWALSKVPSKGTVEFLDYNFIYNPKNFNNLSGGTWKLFRKNIHRFNRFVKLLEVEYRELTKNEKAGLSEVFVEWLQADPERIIEDDSTVLSFLSTPPETLKGLFINGKLYGFNIWDENFKYINFRYCFNNPMIPGLNYKLRLLFYRDEEIQEKGKLVNDGGCLDSDSLRFFKEHLNPIKMIKIFTWRM